ncbi:MAG: hypothetical protein ABI147_11820 [Acidobacteriaceae bacterium]
MTERKAKATAVPCRNDRKKSKSTAVPCRIDRKKSKRKSSSLPE